MNVMPASMISRFSKNKILFSFVSGHFPNEWPGTSFS